MKLNRRETIAAGAAITASLMLSSVASAAPGDVVDVEKLAAATADWTDRPLGDANAPVTVIEYSSPTCPHCARFANETYPEFKKEYVDSGKVRFIVRPFARNVLDAAIFLLAMNAGDQYHAVLDTFFASFDTWTTSQDPKSAMLQIALQLGFTEEAFEAALVDQVAFGQIEALRQQAIDEFGLTGTPTFYINGKTLSGGLPIEALREEIDPLLS